MAIPNNSRSIEYADVRLCLPSEMHNTTTSDEKMIAYSDKCIKMCFTLMDVTEKVGGADFDDAASAFLGNILALSESSGIEYSEKTMLTDSGKMLRYVESAENGAIDGTTDSKWFFASGDRAYYMQVSAVNMKKYNKILMYIKESLVVG